MTNLIGQQIDQYRVDALLGEGNMGAVYQAFDTNLARKVVLKVMHRQLASHESFQQRFMQEAQAAARLDHPSIIKVFNFGSDPSLFMVMEYISGPSLGDFAKHQQQAKSDIVALDTVLRLVAQVADALDYAHGQGVVHRDVKPSNLLLKPLKRPDRDGDPTLRVIVTDFGLAKLLEGGMHTLTGTFMGTLSYMSPEQCLGRDLDGRSDIYSLGIVLYQLATGQLPFNVKSPTDAIRMHVKELPPAPRLIRPGLPEQVEQVILQTIAKNPASRFQTGNQLAEALRRAAYALVSPNDTSTFPTAGDLGSSHGLVGSQAEVQPSLVDQLLIYHAGEAPRIMGMDEDSLTIGRGQDNAVVLPDKGVSRYHATIERTDDGWGIKDLNSTNGAYIDKVRLNPDIIEPWAPNTELRVGAYSLQWQKAMPIPVNNTLHGEKHGSDIDRPTQTNPGEIELVVDPGKVEMEAGDRSNIQVMLINRGPIVEHVNVRCENIPDAWITYSEQLMTLMPGSRGFLRITVAPPRDSTARSGTHAFSVVATPMSNPEAIVRSDCTLELAQFSAFRSQLKPRLVSPNGKCEVTVFNQGNGVSAYTVRSDKTVRSLSFKPRDTEVQLNPGQEHMVEMTVIPDKRPLLGTTKREEFAIEVWSPNSQMETLEGELEIRPIIAPWLLFIVGTLMLAVVVFMIVFTLLPSV